MSKFHGEQFWTTVRHHALCNWRELSDDEFDTLRAIGHDREVRERSVRERVALELAVLARRRESALARFQLLQQLDRIAGTRVV